ncbi:hypothetical protein A1Q2_07372 [Trichosporon asahii var. asahii CBS 8904]|uniref:Uncharacterized protein n=1 Tax=Trichosporon asahii var. asahii (strain CBS 8904) TaxID=1220162 RepID=K1W9N4_TRIAC|nr:hypothetical protein A1Q2_07372 [Trichosporon asahii var. asahii CBS 8904]
MKPDLGDRGGKPPSSSSRSLAAHAAQDKPVETRDATSDVGPARPFCSVLAAALLLSSGFLWEQVRSGATTGVEPVELANRTQLTMNVHNVHPPGRSPGDRAPGLRHMLSNCRPRRYLKPDLDPASVNSVLARLCLAVSGCVWPACARTDTGLVTYNDVR